jgi:1-deoxy-D-xylulose-5-phosphate synthase
MYSTFAQRAVDQVFHDVALPRLRVVLALDRAGAVSDDGETHQGLYDIALFRSFPGLPILAPASAGELAACLEWALDSGGPAVIRFPKAPCPREEDAFAEPIEPGRGVFVRRSGADTLVVALGALVSPAVEASDRLLREAASAGAGPLADVYSARFASPVDEDFFLEIVSAYRRVLIVEDGVERGGMGEGLAALIGARIPRIEALYAGFPSQPFLQAGRDELLARARLDTEGIVQRIREAERGDSHGRIFLFKASGGSP